MGSSPTNSLPIREVLQLGQTDMRFGRQVYNIFLEVNQLSIEPLGTDAVRLRAIMIVGTFLRFLEIFISPI